ncbi:hypothetical protein M9458_055628 [Cirrhinus mrigala]|uniref:Uncharacterized protein n=1 Tax=Cirrhinus mrigala TaxID=683832 RepID=A0ABD0MLF9_CIRMR
MRRSLRLNARSRCIYARGALPPGGISAIWAFRSTERRANSPQCRGSLFSVWSWTRSTRQPASPTNACSSAEVSGIIQTQDSGSSQNISEAPGAYGSRSRGDATGLASYETASALVTRPSPEMGMAPWHTPDWRFPAVSPPVQPVVRPGLSSGRSPSGTSLQASCGLHGCLLHWLGCCMQRASSLGLLDRTSTAMAYQLLAVLLALRRFRPMLRHKHVLVRTDSTATVAYINHQGGLRSRRMSQLARHLLLWSQMWLKFTFQENSTVQPTSSHGSPPILENGDSTPRWSS